MILRVRSLFLSIVNIQTLLNFNLEHFIAGDYDIGINNLPTAVHLKVPFSSKTVLRSFLLHSKHTEEPRNISNCKLHSKVTSRHDLEHFLFLIVHGPVDVEAASCGVEVQKALWFLIHSLPLNVEIELIIALDVDLEHKTERLQLRQVEKADKLP